MAGNLHGKKKLYDIKKNYGNLSENYLKKKLFYKHTVTEPVLFFS